MRKITAGFKCDPGLKEDLLAEAREHGITLSEYLEGLCENRHSEIVRPQLVAAPEIDDERLEELQNKLDRYEHLLGPVFDKYQGQEVFVRLPDGTETYKKVEDHFDGLEIIINAIAPKP